MRHGLAMAGFTLAELLVAIAILALLSTLLFGGLRFGTRAWERAEVHADHASEIQVVQAFLRRRLSEAAPVRKDDGGSKPLIVFDGDAMHLSFVTVMPVHLETGGYANLDLEFRREAGALVLRWRPYDFSGSARQPSGEEVRVLLDRVADVGFAYFGPAQDDSNQGSVWLTQWRDRGRLPALVSLRLRFDDSDLRHWPDLVVRPMVTNTLRRGP
jgi:general secretion pathway protein J